ncbi:MAG TPA: NCS2 family permease [Opitutaceae bacterium]|jgi:AGZA family xanthine/uracil permease-like MFS transporter|nr:NCS2 family permease [Opitutaceae bacterium]
MVREILAGLATFSAMASVLAVHPAILATTGMDKGALVTATALSAAIFTAAMALLTNYPIVMGPAGGTNAYFAFTVCGLMGVPWRAALGLVFYSGVLFFVVSISGIRTRIVDAIPMELKLAITCGIGLFMAFIGLQNGGLVVANRYTLVSMGHLADPRCLLALAGTIFTGALIRKRVRGAVVIGVLAVTVVCGFVHGPGGGTLAHLPRDPVGLPASLRPLFLQLDLRYLWTHFSSTFVVVLALLFVGVFDNLGSLIGICNRAGFLDKDGRVPKAGRVFLADAGAAMLGACLGTSNVQCYSESAIGVEEGGRTGLTAITAAVCMLLALFLTPLILAIPLVATAAPLIIVGVFMMEGAVHIGLTDFGKALPAVITMFLMPLTFSISDSIGIGLVVYAAFNLATGRGRQVTGLAYALAALFLVYAYFRP